MSQLNPTNYPAQTPVAADSTVFYVAADGTIKTCLMSQLATLLQSLASTLLNTVVKSSDYTLTSDDQFVEANSGGAFNLTLPASSLNTGRAYQIFNKGAGAVTILPNGSDTIKGAASLVLAQYGNVLLRSDGLGMWSALVSA